MEILVMDLSNFSNVWIKYETNLIQHPGVLNIFNGVLIYLTFVQDKSIGFYNSHKENMSVWSTLKTDNIKNNYSVSENGIWILGYWYSYTNDLFWQSNFMAFESYS